MAIETASLWMEFLKAAHGAQFGTRDPIFGRDVAFYLFKLPAISDVLTMLETLVVFSFIAAVILYSMRGEVQYRLRRVTATPSASRHLAPRCG